MLPSGLSELITHDHKRIRSLLEKVKTACSGSREQHCLKVFKTLKAFLMAHIKAEEYSLYEMFEDDRSIGGPGLKEQVFRAYEQHDLIEFLLKDMGQAEEISPQWRAQLTILDEMLARHFREEEQRFLSEISKLIEEDDLKEMGKFYLRERDSIFTKRSGLKPTVSLASTSP